MSKKKLLAIVLTLVMVLSLVPRVALAEDGDGQTLPAPAQEKKLIDNGDGTYTIAMSVTGAAESSTTTEVTKANVVLVIDTSSSMNSGSGSGNFTYTEVTGNGTQGSTYWGTDAEGNYIRVYWRNNADPHWRLENNNGATAYNGTVYTRSGDEFSRLEAEKDALTKEGGIIDNLLSQNVVGDPVKNDIIEVAVVGFGGSGYNVLDFTTSGSTLKTEINNLTTSTGTNWEEGLQYAKDVADTHKAKPTQEGEAFYIIFLTDGQPTTHAGDYSVNLNFAQEWAEANDDARDIVKTSKYYLYGLYTWGSGDDSHYLSSLIEYAYADSVTGLDHNSALESQFAQYFTDASDTDTLINALNQIVNDITNSVGYTDVEMTDGVTSMTASNVKVSANGEVAGLKYYRSGGSYSTTANNGLGDEWPVRSESNPDGAPPATINSDGEVDWDLGSLILENGVTYTFSFIVWPKQESLDLVADLNNGIIAYSSLTADQKAQILENNGHYTLKTNTDFPTVSYSVVTTQTVNGETTVTKVEGEPIQVTNPEPVGLTETKLDALKIWEDSLDESQREEVGGKVTLYLLVDGHYYFVGTDGKPIGVTLQESENWERSDYINVAPGIMVTSDSAAYDPDAPHATWDGKT